MALKYLKVFVAAIAAAFLALGAAALVAPARAAEPATYTIQGGLAVGGYDAVAYFTQNQAVQGSAQITATHEGATYRFSSAANRDAFRANPAQYTPQFGGYCAYAVSKNQLAPGNPQFWRVVNGRLYLNVNAGAQRAWLRDVPSNIAKAEANWPAVLERKASLFPF